MDSYDPSLDAYLSYYAWIAELRRRKESEDNAIKRSQTDPGRNVREQKKAVPERGHQRLGQLRSG